MLRLFVCPSGAPPAYEAGVSPWLKLRSPLVGSTGISLKMIFGADGDAVRLDGRVHHTTAFNISRIQFKILTTLPLKV